jgi:hypothetical protein
MDEFFCCYTNNYFQRETRCQNHLMRPTSWLSHWV